MNHTKGEWRATPINTIINAKTKKVIARLARGGRSQKELTANARLIAATPDLLAACKALLDSLCFVGSKVEQEKKAITLARAAMAKANQ